MNLQLLAQGADGPFEERMFVSGVAPKLLHFDGVNLDHALDFFTLGFDDRNILPHAVKRIGGGLLKGPALFSLEVFKLLANGGNCVAQMGRFTRRFVSRIL